MSDRSKITITGGNFTQSAVGIGSIHQHNDARQATAGDLRSALADGREEIVALGRDDAEQARLAHGVDQIQEELSAPKPDADIVRGGWKSVLKVLDAGAAATASIVKISELIGSLFGT